MHGTRESARALAAAIRPAANATIILCPPFTLLAEAGTKFALGGQDCHAQAQGAHTGDISAAMLKDAGCTYVIVGHSERRQNHGETDASVHAKAGAALTAGLTPIVCVGETLEQRKSGRAEAVVAQQIRESAPQGEFILAYEPIWAIGTGETASEADIAAMHRHIKTLLPANTPVLYGGSVKASNAKEILYIPGVDGVLVGGASLKAEEFCAIIDAA